MADETTNELTSAHPATDLSAAEEPSQALQLPGIDAEIRAFVNYLRVDKGLSKNTIESYRRDIVKFGELIRSRELSVSRIVRRDVVDFLAALYRRGLDSRSVARHLATLRHFFRL